jgi:membrane protein implicated in regulation of membrane protease activity
MLYLIAAAILVLRVAGCLLRQPQLIKKPPALTWIALTIISILFLFNHHTLPFALPLQAVAFAAFSLMLSHHKKQQQKKGPRGSRRPRQQTQINGGRVDRIIEKITSP